MNDRQKSMRRTRIGRAAPLVGMAGRTAGSAVVQSLRRKSGSDFHERQANRYADHLGHSRGVLMKAGQILSFTSLGGVVGDENEGVYRRALARLQDSAPPMSAEDAAAVVEAELGAPPAAVFAEFEPEPVAAASIGQVHRAMLHDGRQVAVKVQYPGVADAIRADLANTELLATFFQLVRGIVPSFTMDLKSVAAEVSMRIGEEVDYRIEAANQQRFAAAYRGDRAIRIPRIHPELSTSRVLTMDFVEGKRFTEAVEAPKELRDAWGEAIYRFGIGSLYRFGLFNADPHPGNYLFHDDGTVTFLDFGSIRTLTPDQVAGFRDVASAVASGDAVAGVRALRGWGIESSGDFTSEQIWDWFLIGWENVTAPQPFTFTAEHAADVVRRKYAVVGPGSEVIRSLTIDPAYIMFIRVDLGVISVLGSLGATTDWREVQQEWAEVTA